MINHVKKIQSKYFWDILNNNKRFEIRKNDCMNDNVPWGCCGGCL